MMKINIEGYNVIKDLNSNALLNTDIEKLSTYKNMKLSKKNENERLNKIESDIQEIKALLLSIINKI